MEAKFTKGPLSIKGPSLGEMANDAGGDYAILDEEGLIIGESFCRVSTDEIRPARENATLWAAAPEMYEKSAFKRNVLIRDNLPYFEGEWVAVPQEDFDALRAVRAKARGEQ
ncbi:MAG TPA: hypothetical protein VMX15_06735 [Candidatus Heimdallarchaeota archaeon]|nr:hypothetical protein [Candidatus Heimdallarchaeota archaeon]